MRPPPLQPPELLLDGLLTPATDVYIYGVVLWEMWAGRRAWKWVNAAQIMHGVTTGTRQLEALEGVPPSYQVNSQG